MKGLNIIVLAKQVPDTRNVGQDAMKADGTVNRAALPAIFNPEDMNALEQALRMKDKYQGSQVTVLTMGPVRAAEVLREGLYRGADKGILLTDRAFAGADTLATSYAISCAIKKMKDYDVIICGRQAIDGDTAQVGPQVAEKLNIPQVTYAEEIVSVNKNKMRVKRRLERGVETVEGPLPMVVSVHSSAPECRPRNAKRIMTFKNAYTLSEKQEKDEDYIGNNKPYLQLNEWSVDDIEADREQLGLSGSPTKVKKIENIVFQAKEAKMLTQDNHDIDELMKELINNHTIG